MHNGHPVIPFEQQPCLLIMCLFILERCKGTDKPAGKKARGAGACCLFPHLSLWASDGPGRSSIVGRAADLFSKGREACSEAMA